MSKSLITSPAALGTTAFLTMGGIDLLAHLGPTGLVFGGIAAIIAARHGKDILTSLQETFPGASEEQRTEITQTLQTARTHRSLADRLLGRFPDEDEQQETESEQDTSIFDEQEDELAVFTRTLRPFLFSEMLPTFIPSLSNIYLASQDGTPVYCEARDLCHVALAGSTGGGKSNTMRLLMAQLCKAGASVLLLNPHYTHYDLERDEDWTPFLSYLVHDPMECRKYEVIDTYLRQVATKLLPMRLEKYAHSQPLGKPYFLVLDELPAIIKHVPNAPEYLENILREGRKVGIFLIVASQDFLVKTIAPAGGGAVRDCYRTAFYSGGDATTAKILLDMPANQIPEDALGQGAVMLRSKVMKRAARVSVPYVDNSALYRLLGPSTYVPGRADEQDDQFLENLSRSYRQPQAAYSVPERVVDVPASIRPCSVPQPSTETPVVAQSQRESETTGHFSRDVPPHLQAAYKAYTPGMSSAHLAGLLGVSKATAARYIIQLRERRLIA